jgi:guanylate kinase
MDLSAISKNRTIELINLNSTSNVEPRTSNMSEGAASNVEPRTLNARVDFAREGVLFVVSAPSGAGKTSLCRELIGSVENLRQSISFTTREIREGEVDGVDYNFVSPQGFRDMVLHNQFAEWAEVHGNLYGTALSTLEAAADQGVDLLLDIDCLGAAQLRQSYSRGVFIFILPPDYAILKQRLVGRGTDTEEVIRTRLNNARDEIDQASCYDYLVVNDDFQTALAQMEAIIVAERCRTARSQGILQSFSEGDL